MVKNVIVFIIVTVVVLLIPGCSGTEIVKEPKSATFVINNEIFDASYEKVREWFFFDDSSKREGVLIEEVSNIEEGLLPISYILPKEITPTSTVSGNQDMCYYPAIYERGMDESIKGVFAYDLKSNAIFEIVRTERSEESINYCRWSDDIIFYGKTFESEGISEWSLHALNIKTGKCSEVDNSSNYEKTIMIPTFETYNGILAYLVGEEFEGNYHFYVNVYDGHENKNIFHIENNVETPYMSPYIDETQIAFPNYFEDGWYMMIYDFDTDKIQYAKMRFLSEGEYPQIFHIIGSKIIYGSNFRVLYLVDMENNEFKVVHYGGGSIEKSAYLANAVYYIANGSLWKFNLDTMEKTVLKKHVAFADDLYFLRLTKNETGIYISLENETGEICVMFLEDN